MERYRWGKERWEMENGEVRESGAVEREWEQMKAGKQHDMEEK